MGLLVIKPVLNITEDDLKDVTPSDIEFEQKLNNVRKTNDGTVGLIEVNIRDIGSTKEMDGSLFAFDVNGYEIGKIVDVEKEMAKPEWNSPDLDGDGIITEEELTIWQKIVNWFK